MDDNRISISLWSKRKALVNLVLLLSFTFSNKVLADVVIDKMTIDSKGVPFLLDSKGFVWGFRKPLSLEGPISLSKLRDIKILSAYIAVNRNGSVFTWKITSNIFGPDPEDFSANYTPATQVNNLGHVILTSSSDDHFVIYNTDHKLIEWHDSLQENDKASQVKYKTLSQNKLVKELASTEASTIALLENGSIVSWGLAQTGQTRQDQDGVERSFCLPEKIASIGLNYFHVVALTKSGNVIYWGGCDRDGRDPNGKPYFPPSITAVSSLLPPVSAVAVSPNDNVLPNVFLNSEGKVLVALAPSPLNVKDYVCGRSINAALSSIISGLPDHIISIAVGGGRVLALDAEHVLWKADLQLPLRFSEVKINLNR